MSERLNKVLSRAGVASRRAADKLIEEGRVTVNGSTITELGTRVEPERDAIKVDGKRVVTTGRPSTYLMLYKPREVVTTLSDPEGRRCVGDLVRRIGLRVFPVGRLDYHSEGLLLLTDDGDLARELTHPRSGVPKLYRVKVRGCPDEAALARLRAGIPIDGRRTVPTALRMVQRAHNAWLEIAVTEGRKHIVRRLFEALGHPVVKLRRVAFGGIGLGDMEPGGIRALTSAEVARLRRASEKRSRRGPVRAAPNRRN
ncbi:MAG: rRNA pseudouridine synthase [bacterium]|nr:rRNA pseudouridine synthase [bacterium]